jgi:hypothetical protein
MKKNYILFLLFIVIGQIANAQTVVQSNGVPACPYFFDYQQPDGKTLTMKLNGDGIVHWGEMVDGFTVLSDEKGFYKYAYIDKNYELKISEVIATNNDERTFEEINYLDKIEPELKYSENQIDELIANHKFHKNSRSKASKAFPTTGERKMLLMIVNYADTDTTFSQENFNNYMNESSIKRVVCHRFHRFS